MKHRSTAWPLALLLVLAACGGGPAAEETSSTTSGSAADAASSAPSAADLEYAEITAAWTDEAYEGCGRVLQEALGTRDLVQSALDGVEDPSGKAEAEIDDATYWLGLGKEKLGEVRPQLVAGECGGDITLALDEAVQFFVKAGTSAVQAGQIAGS